MPGKVVNLALRGVQFLWTLLIMALTGNVIADAFAGNPSIVNYTIFVSVFAMLSLFYLIPVAFNDGLTGHPAIPVALDLINVLLLFCGGVALAAELGVHSCSNPKYVNFNHITNGSHDPSKRCRELQAVDAFYWFAFAAWVVSLAFSAMGARGSGANMRSGGIRKGGPVMSQV